MKKGLTARTPMLLKKVRENCLTINPKKAMAKNGKVGDGHRNGAVRDRSQTFNPKIERWVERDTPSGQFINVKSNSKPFKGVTKEK